MRFEEALKAMTNLTEQWKKGELKEGWYYTKIDLYENGDYFKIIPNKYNDDFEYGIVKQVLAPVPNYYDWKKAYDCVVSENEEITTLKTDCQTLAQKLLQVKPELREWLEVNYKEYL